MTGDDWTTALPESCKTVIHLAQSTRYREFPEGAEDMMRVNVQATVQLLEWARTHDVDRFIFASTASVYKPIHRPVTETDRREPTTFYGATKLAAENLVQCYIDYFDVIICRIFTVYGPGQKDKLVPGILNRIRTGQAIQIQGGTGPSLSPIHIDDLCRNLEHLIDAPSPSLNILNLSGTEKIDIKGLAERAGRALGIVPKFETIAGIPDAFVGDRIRAKAMGLKSKISLTRGLDDLILERCAA
jgi:nucleoside-diphosphate-sugar epimerase